VSGRRALALLSLALLPACLSFNWRRQRHFVPAAQDALDGLEIGRTTLADCLLRLGAPLYVWEYKGNGAVLAWGAGDEDMKGMSLSVPVETWFRPSFSYQDIAADLRGPVLFFDDRLVLVGLEEGYLRDYRERFKRARPAAPPPEASESAG